MRIFLFFALFGGIAVAPMANTTAGVIAEHDYIEISAPKGNGASTGIVAEKVSVFGQQAHLESMWDLLLAPAERAHFSASAKVQSDFGKLHVQAKVVAIGADQFWDIYGNYDLNPYLNIDVVHYEEIKFIYKLPGPAPDLPTSISAKYSFSGSASATVDGNIGGQFSISTSSTFWFFHADASGYQFAPIAAFDININHDDNTARFSTDFRVGLAIRRGSATFSFGDTIEPVAFLFPDGTTPESNGWELVFDSGATSPNVEALNTPEPSTLALWTIGGLAIAATRRRRGGLGGTGVSPVPIEASEVAL